MKKLLLIISICTVGMVKAQVAYPEIPQEPEPVEKDAAQEPESDQTDYDYLRVYYIKPSGVGNNVLAKANDGKGGIGLGVNFYNVRTVPLAIIGGLEFSTYNITDVSLTANGSRTIITSFYLGGEYKLKIGRHFSLNPSLCFVPTRMTQRNSDKRLGTYYGNGIWAGVTFNYTVLSNVKLFVGAVFVHSWYDVNTYPQYEDYYRKVSTINLTAGIKL